MIKLLLFVGMLFGISACGVSSQSENYEMTGPSPLTLTVQNHTHGFTKQNCFACHIPHNLHQVDHLGDPSFPYAQLYVERQGLSSCSGCHGQNGVSP